MIGCSPGATRLCPVFPRCGLAISVPQRGGRFHSARSACIGSTTAAFRDGTYVAMHATIRMETVATKLRRADRRKDGEEVGFRGSADPPEYAHGEEPDHAG